VVTVFSSTTSNADASKARDEVGRPPGLPLRPLRNLPEFGFT
jgi:hypothetical protein